MLFSSLIITATCASVNLYMTKLFSPILLALQNAQPIGTILAVVLAIISLAVVTFLSAAFWLGYEGKGCAIGWEICGPFSWRWFNGGI